MARRGGARWEWKRFREDLRRATQDRAVYVGAPAGCHNTNHPTADAKRGDEKQVVFFFKGLNVLYTGMRERWTRSRSKLS